METTSDAMNSPGAEFADRLDRQVAQALSDLEGSAAYRFVTRPTTRPRFKSAFANHLLLELFSLEPPVAAAALMAIRRRPENRPDLVLPETGQHRSAVSHGETTLQGSIRPSGIEAWAHSRPLTQAAFAVGAICHALAEQEGLFAYLGCAYLWEGLVGTLMSCAQELAQGGSFPAEAERFFKACATEPIVATGELRELIIGVVNDDASAATAIEYGLHCLAAVYPLPLWEGALHSTRLEEGSWGS
jgi:hypothetical protein